MDSYLILPSSLKSLSNSFNVENPKGIFPFHLKNINYKGIVPDFKHFEGITIEEYENYKNQFVNTIWDFREESVKYCLLDCVSLFQVLTKYNQLIFNKFNLNITKYPTLPSLAFAIFRTHYLKKESIHMISGKIADDIRTGYTGGAVDMYIPISPPDKYIYAYDVNSLYPSVMINNKYPIGNPTYFEGDITKYYPNAFGFFFCKIVAPSFLKHPILQTHINTKNGIRTISPLGT